MSYTKKEKSRFFNYITYGNSRLRKKRKRQKKLSRLKITMKSKRKRKRYYNSLNLKHS